jgi:hypothetical protein
MSAMIRRRHPPYYPAWGDEKHREAIRSASLCQFDVDLSDQILNEIRNRAQRTGSPRKGPQPWLIADIKVWREFARQRGHLELEDRMDAAVAAWYRRNQ